MKEKKSFLSILLGLSFWMILFTWEGGITIQSIIPLIIIALLHEIIKKTTKIKLDKYTLILFYFVIIIIFSTIINTIRHIDVVSSYNLTGIIYFVIILFWFYLCTKDKKNNSEINFILNNYLIVSTILSLMIMKLSFSGISGKIAVVNFLGTLCDENLITAVISMAPIISLIYILYSKNGKTRKKFMNIIYFIFNIIGLCLAGSRASLIGCFLSLILIIIIYMYNGNKIKLFFMILFVFGVAIFAKNLMPDWIYTRYFESNYMDKSNTTRILIWKNALNGISKQPILGFGMGTFPSLKEYEYTAGYSTPAHQTFLDIFLYSGIIGLIIFIYFLYFIFKDFIFSKSGRIFLPIICNLLFISLIISATKTIFFWNTIIILRIFNEYLKTYKVEDLLK